MAESDKPEDPKPIETQQTPPPTKKPLGPEAWAAISAIAVALISAVVTLITHFTPEAEPPKASTAVNPTVSTQSQSPQMAVPGGIGRIVGRWLGEVQSSQGKFTIELVVSARCAEGQPCGTISVSHLPCYGEISLLGVRGDGSYEFNVDRFRASSSSGCHPGPGEYFLPTAGGQLIYSTGYDGSIRATLNKQP